MAVKKGERTCKVYYWQYSCKIGTVLIHIQQSHKNTWALLSLLELSASTELNHKATNILWYRHSS